MIDYDNLVNPDFINIRLIYLSRPVKHELIFILVVQYNLTSSSKKYHN
jgi:hypothetical protein